MIFASFILKQFEKRFGILDKKTHKNRQLNINNRRFNMKEMIFS